MTPPTSRAAGGPADPGAVQDLGARLVARVPDLVSIWTDDLGVEAAFLRTETRVTEAIADLTEAIAVCGVGTIRDDFQAATRRSLGVLIAAWRRADLRGSRLTEGLARLGDRMIEELQRIEGADGGARARAAACVLDATQILIRRTDRTFRAWDSRSDSDDVLALGAFGEALAHELRNRIHAAETALDLLRQSSGSMPLSRSDRHRLQRLLLDAVRTARRAVYDMRRITAATPRDGATVSTPLHEMVRRTVARMSAVAMERNVEIEISGPLSGALVDARGVQVALNNLIDVAIRRASSLGGGHLRLRTPPLDDSGVTEIHVEGPDGFLDPDIIETLFEPDLVDLGGSGPQKPEEMSLWLTREAIEHLGGALDVAGSEHGAASALVLRIPALESMGPTA